MTKRDREKQAEATTRDPRWSAVLARATSADGTFVYGVRTTGVYCRPSCPSRRARPENVELHDTAASAERSGFRPCLRCRPNGASPADHRAHRVAAICRSIEASETPPTLAALAAEAGMSPHHLQRLFKAVTGLTPRAYAAEIRAARVRRALERGAPVTDALYDAGYGSSGRFYEASSELLGMTPKRYREGGPGTLLSFAVGACSLGAVLVAESERGVAAILLGDDPEALIRDLEDRFPDAELIGADARFEARVAAVVGLIEAPGLGHTLPLDIQGTAFQRRVWEALTAIPAGATASYTEVAERIGAPASVRAVAQACGANPLAVAIPCHRVVRRDGGLSGYRWGIDRKRALLARERSDP